MARPKKPVPAKKTAKKKSPAKKGEGKNPNKRKPKGIDLKSSLARLTSRSRSSSKTLAVKKAQPLVFTIEDAREELARLEKLSEENQEVQSKAKSAKKPKAKKKSKAAGKAKKKGQTVGAASIMDLLGFDPSAKGSREADEKSKVSRKWMPYYNSLVELRKHFKNELDVHTKDTLALDSSSEADNYAGYAQEKTDSDSGQFDREVALNMLASEQDALYEVEEAIQRILDDRYGICEVTGKPIKKTRLRAVPFTRYSLEGQQQFENQNRQSGDRGHKDLFIERDEDTSQMLAPNDGEE